MNGLSEPINTDDLENIAFDTGVDQSMHECTVSQSILHGDNKNNELVYEASGDSNDTSATTELSRERDSSERKK